MRRSTLDFNEFEDTPTLNNRSGALTRYWTFLLAEYVLVRPRHVRYMFI